MITIPSHIQALCHVYPRFVALQIVEILWTQTSSNKRVGYVPEKDQHDWEANASPGSSQNGYDNQEVVCPGSESEECEEGDRRNIRNR